MKTNFTSETKRMLSPQRIITFVLVMLTCFTAISQVKHIVNVSNYKFTPSELTVSMGDTVEWRNTQGTHDVNGTISKFPLNPESFGNLVGSNWVYQHIFNIPGKYDYVCDPHASLGMTGKIEVMEKVETDSGKYNLTINFSGMTPHVGQMLSLQVVDKSSEQEIARIKQVISVDFSVMVSGIEKGHSYFVNFFADFNKNGMYDAPPVDHAWQLELNDVSGDAILNFAHNTNFTDIQWKNKLTIHFMGMTPHVGQTLKLAVIDKDSGIELERLNTIVEVDFMIDIYGTETGKSYNIDFFADFNKNGMYDAPPVDHAWRLQLDDVMGDTILNFTHNTNFTNIAWKNELTVHFMSMNPHVGQDFHLWVVDKATGMAVDSASTIAEVEFSIISTAIETGKSYNIDFYADFNNNGQYDAPPVDHAWRLELNNVKADTMLMFTHNTNFTDIKGSVTAVSAFDKSLFRIYPNPVKDKLFIETGEKSQGNLEISIYDINGKLKYKALKSVISEAVINVNNLSSGIYFVEIQSMNGLSKSKIVKY